MTLQARLRRLAVAIDARRDQADAVRAALGGVAGVASVHDLHVWTLVPGKDMVTAHLSGHANPAGILRAAQTVLGAHGLDHATIQVEPAGGDECAPTF